MPAAFEDGKRCLGDHVNYICSTFITHTWSGSALFDQCSNAANRISVSTSSHNQGDVISCGAFAVTITNVASNLKITSELSFIATAMMDGTVVECSDGAPSIVELFLISIRCEFVCLLASIPK